ncbi:hypothetical protein XabCFBP2524_05515 [Xanthomonas axonopodis pv. begoniae]|nr:hypothetical protein XabCFBP2524_05515 [Xanthomonas axonopodis pv. begoniae]
MWLLGLVRGWVAAVCHVDGDALLSSRCTSANKHADGSRATPLENSVRVTRKQKSAASVSLDVFEIHRRLLRSPGSTAWSLR